VLRNLRFLLLLLESSFDLDYYLVIEKKIQMWLLSKVSVFSIRKHCRSFFLVEEL
jgi:hypothetical protein